MRNFGGKKLLSLFHVIFLCVISFGFLAACDEKPPVIDYVDPRIGQLGEVIVVHGSGFGDERKESFLTIAGTSPTSSSYLSWSDTEISVRVPEFGEAGLIYIHRGRLKSNSALFTNQNTLPESITDEGVGPRISSIEPASGAIGSLITIQGNNFGSSRENSGVFFSWDADSPTDLQDFDFIEAFGTEFAYELWSEREIQVRVPDGAISGNLEIRTPKGNSQPVFFEITGRPGTKTFKDKRSYIISYSADFSIEQAITPNILYVWMPGPAISASQRNVKLLSRSMDPFVENYRGTSLFQFIDTHSGTSWKIALSFKADVYEIQTTIRSQTPIRLNRPSPVGTFPTLPSAIIPSEAPLVKEQIRTIIGNERLPHPKALRIYNWLISSIKIFSLDQNGKKIVSLDQNEKTNFSGSALEALRDKEADSYSASLLFCALARAAEIPAQPVAGVLISPNGNTAKHCWAEFWLDGFGWIPLDPALGAGASPPDFDLVENHARYYFGNLDNKRVAFSRGEHSLSQMTPRGRTALRSREYSIQNIWEEATGGLHAYYSHWSDVTISEIPPDGFDRQ